VCAINIEFEGFFGSEGAMSNDMSEELGIFFHKKGDEVREACIILEEQLDLLGLCDIACNAI
jgi:hypothetical protein